MTNRLERPGMGKLAKFILGLVSILLCFVVTPITSSIALGLALLWMVGWLVVLAVVFVPHAVKTWHQASAEIKAEDAAWDSMLMEKWDAEETMNLLTARKAGWHPEVARKIVQGHRNTEEAKLDAQNALIRAEDEKETAIALAKKIYYWKDRTFRRRSKGTSKIA